MNSIPLISHRLFVAAVGPKDTPRQSLRSLERRKFEEQQVREIPLQVVAPFLSEPRQRTLTGELVASNV